MSRTKRTVRVADGDGIVRETERSEAASWRADRNERLIRSRRDAKSIDRGERYSARRENDKTLPVGSTVRAVA